MNGMVRVKLGNENRSPRDSSGESCVTSVLVRIKTMFKRKFKIKRATERLHEQDIHWVDEKNFPVKKGERVFLECEFVKVGKVLSLRTIETGQPITIRDHTWSEILVEDTAEETQN